MNKLSNRRLARGFVEQLNTGSKPKALINQLAAEIVETKQVGNLDLIINDINRELETQMSVTNARVYSARELTSAIKADVAKMIKQMQSTDKVNIEEKVDPSLLGGIRVETPEREIDLTLKNKLKTIGGQIK